MLSRPHDSQTRRSRCASILVLAACVLGVATGADAQTATRTATPVPTATATPALVRIALSPATATRQVGQIQNFLATAIFSDGTQKNFTQKVVYASSDLNVVFPPNEVGNAGRVEAVGIGTATISATEPTTGISSNSSGESAVMTVVQAPTPTPTRTGATPTRTRTPTPTPTSTPRLTTLTLSPADAKRNAGQTQNFSVSGTFSDGNVKNMTQLVNYASSNPSVAQAPNEAGNKGKVNAVGPGEAIISASDPISGVTTTASGGDATFVVVVPPTPTATRTGPTPTPTISPSPTISATPRLERIVLNPLTAKRQLGQTQNFSVNAIFSDGSSKNFTQKVVYFSSKPDVVFPPNEVGNAGRVEAVGIGTAVISATEPSTGIGSAANESALMEVVIAPTPTPTRTGTTPTRTRTPTPIPTSTPRLTTLTISPLTAKRNAGQTQNFSVSGTFSDGNSKNMTQLVNYASSNTAVAVAPNEAGNKGKVNAVGPGESTISATDPISGVSTTATGGDAVFTVVVPPTPTATRTGPTPTPTLSPTPTVSATPVLVSIAVSPLTAKRNAGSFQNFTCTGTYSNGTTKNFTQRCTYVSSDTNVAVAPNDENANKGRVNAVGIGVATISAFDEDTGIATTAAGNASFTVAEAPTPTPTRTGPTPTKTRTPTPTPTSTPVLLSLALSPVGPKRPAGSFQNFSCTGTYSDGNTKNLTQKCNYTSSDPTVAFPPNESGPGLNKGRVNALKPGTATISATDPDSGMTTTASGGDAIFLVTEAPTPTPTHTGPTSTAPTGTPTLTPSPTPSATPKLTKIVLAPKTAQKGTGATQNFTATGTFSDGSTRSVTQRVDYHSSDPTIAEAPNETGNKSKVIAVKIGVVTISATDPTTGVSSADSDDNATFTVVVGSGTPRPRVTATPGLPIQTGNPTTTCQRDVRRSARGYVEKKLKALDRCGSAAARCIQRKPNDPNCLTGVRTRCGAALTKLADEQAKLIATAIRRCAALSSADVLGPTGLAFSDLASTCSTRYSRPLTDLASVAQCLAAQHSCRSEFLYALERPRAGELLELLGAPSDAATCREDFGGSGVGLNDPKGLGKTLERCVKAIVRGGANLARTRLASVGRCIDDAFVCVEAFDNDAACLVRATKKCDREYAKVQREVGKLTLTTARACNDFDFALLRGSTGAYLDAVMPDCPSYGVPAVTSIGDYVACLVNQHECEVADLLRFESPRASAVLTVVGRTLVDGTCPAP